MAATTSESPHVEVEHDELEDAEDELTDYERMRLQLIARNRERLLALGIPDAVAGLNALIAHAKPARHKHKKTKGEAPAEGLRKSTRLHGGAAAAGGGAEGAAAAEEPTEEDKELAMFVIDGECPRCGRLMSRGHRQHLARCQGREEAEPIVLTEEEQRVQAAQLKRKENEKLQALELEGLIDLTPDTAVFCVLGSTRTPYRITLSDDKRKCQCIDHRIRKHDCKHIKLILQSLGVREDPSKWRQAVEDHFKTVGAAAAAEGTAAAAAPDAATTSAPAPAGPSGTEGKKRGRQGAGPKRGAGGGRQKGKRSKAKEEDAGGEAEEQGEEEQGEEEQGEEEQGEEEQGEEEQGEEEQATARGSGSEGRARARAGSKRAKKGKGKEEEQKEEE